MENNFHSLYNEILNALSEAFESNTQKAITDITFHLKNIELEINSFKEFQQNLNSNNAENVSIEIEQSNRAILYHANLIELINKLRTTIEAEMQGELQFNAFEQILANQIADKQQIIIEEQSSDRFISTVQDTLKWKIIKFSKYLLFIFSTSHLRILNLFRKLFKKQQKPIPFWKHKIFVSKIARNWIFNPFVTQAEQLKKNLYVQVIDQINSILSSEFETITKPVNVMSLQINWEGFNKELQAGIKQEIQGLTIQNKPVFLHKINISNTIELPNLKLKYLLRKEGKKAKIGYNSKHQLWRFTMQSLLQKWIVRHELFSSAAHLHIHDSKFQMNFHEKFYLTISDAISKQTEYVKELKKDFSTIKETDSTGLRSFIVKSIYKINKTLAQQVKEVSNLLFSQNLLNITDILEIDIAQNLNNLPDKAIIFKSKNLQKGLNESDVSYFSLKEYVEFNSLHNFSNNILNLKQALAKGLEEINNEAQDFHQILDFCFDSALDIMDNENQVDEAELPTTVISNGLAQTIKKNEEFIVLVESLYEQLSKKARYSVNELNQNILSLQIGENLVEINLQLTKAKFKTKTTFLRNQFLAAISVGLILLKSKFDYLLNSIKKNIDAVKRKLRISAPQKQISAQLSNYLVESNENINKLPLVYRRLFELKPVEEMNLFLGRSAELEKLNDAYQNWLKGKYAISLLYGENGSGKSSLLNNFMETAKLRHNVNYHKLESIYFSQQDFYNLINQVFEINISTKQELDEYIENLDNKKIVIIDGVEKLFLRKINGYDCFQNFLEFVALSNQKIFWILTSSYYAWNYLDKVLNSNDYIDYRIELQILNNEEIRNIILKRNRLSGYKISFLPSIDDNRNRKFQRMIPEKQQEYLEKKYFISLNKFAEGNVSLALSSWLNSIHQIKDNTLFVNSFKTLEFSFLNSLSADKIYTLLLTIFHGKISVAHHSEIFHHSIEKSRRILLVMKEDAILVKKEEYYYINSILFRHVIGLLKNKNLIH